MAEPMIPRADGRAQHDTTRRAFLATAAAVSVGTLAAGAAITEAAPNDPVLALFAQWQDAKARSDAAEQKVEAIRATLPEEAHHAVCVLVPWGKLAFDVPSEGEIKALISQQTWDKINRFRGRLARPSEISEMLVAWEVECRNFESRALAALNEARQNRDQMFAECGLDAAINEADACCDEMDDLAERLIAEPSTSVAGITAKLRVIHAQQRDGDVLADYTAEWLANVIAEAERLTGMSSPLV